MHSSPASARQWSSSQPRPASAARLQQQQQPGGLSATGGPRATHASGIMCRAAAEGEEAPYALLIDSLGASSQWQDALVLLSDMRELDPLAVRNAVTYKAAVAACSRAGQWLQAVELLRQAASQGDFDLMEILPQTIQSCSAARRWEVVLQLLKETRQRSVPVSQGSLRAALGACHGAELWEHALQLFMEMEEQGFPLEPGDANIVLQGLAHAQPEVRREDTAQEKKEKAELRAVAERLRISKRPADITSGRRGVTLKLNPVLINEKRLPPRKPWSSRVGERFGDVFEHHRQFQPRTNLPYGGEDHGGAGQWRIALVLFEQLGNWGVGPETVLANAALTACARAQELARCVTVVEDMHLKELAPDGDTYVTLICGCHKRGLWEQALQLLGKAKEAGLAKACTYLEALEACARGRKPRLALLLLSDMERCEGGSAEEAEVPGGWVSTEAITLGMKACAHHGLWLQTLALLAELRERELEPSMATYSAGAEACAAASDNYAWEHAIVMLEESQLSLLKLNAKVYAGAVRACSHYWELALAAVDDMLRLSIVPTRRTYADTLRACAKVGKSKLAVQVLEASLRESLDAG